jgi:hypothetical protein
MFATRLATLAAIALVGAATVGSAEAAYVATSTSLSDDFEDYNTQVPVNSSPFTDRYTVGPNTVDLVGPGSFAALCLNGTKCVDLVGTNNNLNGGFTTVNAFDANDYKVSFQVFGNGRYNVGDPAFDKIDVIFGGVTQTLTGIGRTADFLATLVFANVAQGAKLQIVGYGERNQQGPLIDNLTVSVVPIPAAALLFATALGGLAWARRRASVDAARA